jgi:hypothetical protein
MREVNTTSLDEHYKMIFRPFLLATPSYLEGCVGIDYESGLPMSVIGIFALVAFVSMVCSTFIALTIFYNKKLSIHPSKLIGYMCLCEGISCYNALIWAAGP